jgi:cytochrome c oxidase subunit 2
MKHVEIRVLAEDTSWSAFYLPDEVSTGREVHVPLGADVSLTLTSRNYVSLFFMPAFALRDFASPGLPGTFRFRADQVGSYELRGDELCGLPHGEKTRGRVVVEEPEAFQSWLKLRRGR